MSNALIRSVIVRRAAGSPVTSRTSRLGSGTTRTVLPPKGCRTRARSTAEAYRSETTSVPALSAVARVLPVAAGVLGTTR